MFAVERKQQVGNFVAGMAVEVTGWLIGEQQIRAAVERAGQRHALLLAAGKLGGKMLEAFAKPELFQQRFCPLSALRVAFTAQQRR